MLHVSANYIIQGRRSWVGIGRAIAHPGFGRSVNPNINQMGQIVLPPLILGLSALGSFLRPCFHLAILQKALRSGAFANIQRGRK